MQAPMPNTDFDPTYELTDDSDDSGTPPRDPSLGMEWDDDEDITSEPGQPWVTYEEPPEPVLEELRRRVDLTDPEGRCLIENVSPWDYTYCMPRTLSDEDDLLTILEYHWNMKYLSLNLDTRYNVFKVSASLRSTFDSGEWILVPEEEVVERFSASLKECDGKFHPVRENFPTFTETTFKYRMIPITEVVMKMTISRQNTVHPNGTAVLADNVTVHEHPFQTLPLLESHLHPKFVLFDAGRKLDAVIKSPTGSEGSDFMQALAASMKQNYIYGMGLEDDMKELADDFNKALKERLADIANDIRGRSPVITEIEKIYKAWMVKPDLSIMTKDEDFHLMNGDDNQSIQTKESTTTGPRKSKKPLGDPLVYGAGPSRHRKHETRTSRGLSERSLRKLDAEQGKEWTEQSIAVWAEGSAANGAKMVPGQE
ncbi:hypothetical protein QCA50_010915 [Cerrena zonata]|uniref:Uncharacterized protein n=1 Tax=Cerrena zonata TaxID=2478898 RepID=A0AAW0G7Y7_9APHY